MTRGGAVRAANLVIDCVDLDRMSEFWGALLGMEVTQREERWLDLESCGDGGPVLSLQRVPDEKAGKNRVHLDLEVPDLGWAAARARGLGASLASSMRTGGAFQVWRDPEGNEFCFVRAARQCGRGL